MYLQEIVEVAIGLIFAWLLLSIAVLQVQEVIAAGLKKRAKDLEKTIGNMLQSGENLEKFYNHPLIQGLMEPTNTEKVKKLRELEKKDDNSLTVRERYQKWAYSREETKSKNRKPSYIPAQTFATVLFDVVTSAGTESSKIKQLFTKLRDDVEKLKEGDQKTANQLISSLIALGESHASTQIVQLKQGIKGEMIGIFDKLEQVGVDEKGNKPLSKSMKGLKEVIEGEHPEEIASLLKNIEPYLDQVRKGALTAGSTKLGEAISSLLSGVEEYATSTDKAIALGRKNVETWFDNTMERMNGWYKRWAQRGAFIIALIVAAIFNIDSIHIAQELWRNPATRQASTAYIESFVEKNTEGGKKLEDSDLRTIDAEIQKLNFPVGWKFEEYTGNQKVKLFAGPDEIAGICTYLIDTNQDKEGIQPLFCYEMKAPPENGFAIVTMFLGWLITAGAAMQGAPFWFDTLKKLVNVRSSGANPAEKPKEETNK